MVDAWGLDREGILDMMEKRKGRKKKQQDNVKTTQLGYCGSCGNKITEDMLYCCEYCGRSIRK